MRIYLAGGGGYKVHLFQRRKHNRLFSFYDLASGDKRAFGVADRFGEYVNKRKKRKRE